MTIPETGEDIARLVEEAIGILEDNNIELPDFNKVTFSKFSELNGGGDPFDGTQFSIIL